MTDRAALQVTAVRWPEVETGADLATLVLTSTSLQDGDVLVITSKVVSKSEGRSHAAERAAVVAAESRRVVARRGSLVIAETAHGLVMAAAGVDSSNTPPGTSIALPADPDGTARRLREEVFDRAGRNVAIVISDTAGRAWRTGQTDLAIGCAGIDALESLQGQLDSYGNELLVTSPAIADELAAAGDLVKGKRTGCPLAVVRGLDDRVLPPGRHGDGAVALVRSTSEDLFALGTREAVLTAVLREDEEALAHFPRLAPDERPPFDRIVAPEGIAVRVAEASRTTEGAASRGWYVAVMVEATGTPSRWLAAGRVVERVHAVAAAHGLVRTAVESSGPSWGEDMTVVDSTLWSTS